MGRAVRREGLAQREDLQGHVGVDWHLAKRCLPGAGLDHRHAVEPGAVVRAEDHDGRLDARVPQQRAPPGRGDRARVDETSVGHERADRPSSDGWFPGRRETGLHELAQAVGSCRVEGARDRRRANLEIPVAHTAPHARPMPAMGRSQAGHAPAGVRSERAR